MTGKKMAYLIAAVAVVVIAYFGWKMTSRNAYESAEYTVLDADGSFEVRDYPDLMLVTTSSTIQSQGNDGSFGRLFQYISGKNQDDRKVAMTTPVFMEPESEETNGQMGFVIPKDIAAASVPEPSSEDVQIQKRSGGRFAVVRFAGRMNEETKVNAEEKLRKWMDSKGLQGGDQIEFAGYDPPWTPGPFRRNEILIRLSQVSR
jgi:DNA gyrase inhibitor GyrI